MNRIRIKSNMAKTDSLTQENYAIGDAAVDGLLNGVIAGVVMGLYMLLVFLANNVPIGEILSYFSNTTTSPIIGALIHLAISGIYGVLFGLVYSQLTNHWQMLSSLWIAVTSGLAYGAILWLVASFIVFRGSLMAVGIPGEHLLIAHLFFGLLLGLLTKRSSPDRGSVH